MFEIVCSELTPECKKDIAGREVAVLGKPLRMVLAAGGAYLVYYGTAGSAPFMFKSAAAGFAVVGIAAFLLAIFAQKLVELRYFAKQRKAGCFPAGASAGEGGLFVRWESAKSKLPGERFFSYSELGKIEDAGSYFKISLLSGAAPGVFLCKADFVQGDPEDFPAFVASKKANFAP